MPENARKAIEKAIEVNKPQNFAYKFIFLIILSNRCGILVSALNVISIFSDPT